jgi:hypothetical protein
MFSSRQLVCADVVCVLDSLHSVNSFSSSKHVPHSLALSLRFCWTQTPLAQFPLVPWSRCFMIYHMTCWLQNGDDEPLTVIWHRPTLHCIRLRILIFWSLAKLEDVGQAWGSAPGQCFLVRFWVNTGERHFCHLLSWTVTVTPLWLY